MPNESIKKIFLVSLGVCLVCSFLVSTTAVTLYNKQNANKRIEKIKNILIAGDLFTKNANVAEIYQKKVKPFLIELETGDKVNETELNEELNIERFDIKEISNHPKYGKEISQKNDVASIKRMPRYMVVYLVETESREMEKVILPVYGKGLWSTMYGFLALEKDLKTVSGITFYEHGETPGLGGEIENPRWTGIWKGKIAFDETGNMILEILKGSVDPSRKEAIHQIDGISGATITTRGVYQLTKFWLGPEGYQPFLDKLREKS
jgi:Na+-transporting NADH:ubiquinone oxidoreductase subunit C